MTRRGRTRSPRAWCALIAALAWAMAGEVRAAVANRIVAVVNDEVITNADVAAQVTELRDELAQQDAQGPPDEAEIKRAALRRLIEQRLILQEAKRTGVTIGSDEVLKQLQRFRSRFGSPEAFERSLRESGMTQEQLKEQLREQLMVQRLVERAVRSTIIVSPQEVAQELSAHPELSAPGDRVRTWHLLIRVHADRTAEQAEALIRRLHQQLADGAAFAELARRDSEDSHRDQGGLMGWVAQGELLPELDAALFDLAPGTLSAPIRTRLGFHLLKAEARRSAQSLSLTEAHHAVAQELYRRKVQQAFSAWLNELHRKAYVELVEP